MTSKIRTIPGGVPVSIPTRKRDADNVGKLPHKKLKRAPPQPVPTSATFTSKPIVHQTLAQLSKVGAPVVLMQLVFMLLHSNALPCAQDRCKINNT